MGEYYTYKKSGKLKRRAYANEYISIYGHEACSLHSTKEKAIDYRLRHPFATDYNGKKEFRTTALAIPVFVSKSTIDDLLKEGE